jgi:hypothetical protein
MQLWQFSVVVCAGIVATAACDTEGGDILRANEAGSSGSSGASGSTNNGGTAHHAGNAGVGGSAGSAGHAGAGTAGHVGTPHAGENAGGDAGSGGVNEGGAGAAGAAGAGDAGGAGGADAGGAGGGAGGEGGEGGSVSEPEGPLAHCVGCTRTKIGAPLWEPSGVVAVPSSMPSFEGYLTFLNDLTAPNHTYDMNDNIIGPGPAHAGPYDNELYGMAVAKSVPVKQAFTVAEFSDPSGVTIMMNIIPSAGAAVGSSVDFASGPIIPNALFPIAVDGDMLREGVMYDADFDSSYPVYPGMTPPIVKDGPSHLVWFFGENSSFGPENTPATGNFEFNLNITDSTGAGWNVKVPFTVHD